MPSLTDAPVGKWKIKSVCVAPALRSRLHALGIAVGAEIEVKSHAPFGGGVELRACGRLLGLRASVAQGITVVPLTETLPNLTAVSSPTPPQESPTPPHQPSRLPSVSSISKNRPQPQPSSPKSNSKQATPPTPTVALLGTPNAGKSTLFNLLTGAHARVSNYTGVTVGVQRRTLTLSTAQDPCAVTLCDLPGTYTLSGFSKEERIALQFLTQTPPSALLLVTECALLPRNRPFISQALALGIPTLVLLNMADEFHAQGGKANETLLSNLFGAPVLVVSARNKGDVHRIKAHLAALLAGQKGLKTPFQPSPISAFPSSAPRFAPTAGDNSQTRSSAEEERLFSKAFHLPPSKDSPLNRLLRKPFFAFFAFALLLFAVFYAAFGRWGMGTLLKGAMERGISRLSTAFTVRLAPRMPSVLSLFIQKVVIVGVGGVLCFLPQLAVLFTLVTLLEESGVLSRFAFFTDGFFCKIGLSGRAIFCMLLGYGCTAVALESTRGMETQSARKKTALLLPYLPCSARMPAFTLLVSSFFGGNVWVILLLYLLSLLLSLGITAIFSRREQNAQSVPFVIEFPPCRIPPLKILRKALLNYLRSFIIRVATTVFLTVSVLFALTLLTPRLTLASSEEESMLAALSKVFVFLFYPMGIQNWRFFAAALAGVVAKESVAATLAALFPQGMAQVLSPLSAFAYLIFLALYPPCVVAISATAKEFGKRFAAKALLLQTAVALLAAYLLPLLVLAQKRLTVPLFLVQIALFTVATILLFRNKPNEKNYRKSARQPKGAIQRRMHLFAPVHAKQAVRKKGN